MKPRFRLYRRFNGGRFYLHNNITGKQESLGTTDRTEASRLLHAKNEASRHPLLNVQIARAYLAANDTQVGTRNWQDVMARSKKRGRVRLRRGLGGLSTRPSFLRVWRTVSALAGKKKIRRSSCEIFLTPRVGLRAIGAWDMSELGRLGRGEETGIGKPGTGEWDRTVQFQGNVYHAGAVNYAMWGRINALCGADFYYNKEYSLENAVLFVNLFKYLYPFYFGDQTEEATAFTKWGYFLTDPKDFALKSPVGVTAIQDPTNVAKQNSFAAFWTGLTHPVSKPRCPCDKL